MIKENGICSIQVSGAHFTTDRNSIKIDVPNKHNGIGNLSCSILNISVNHNNFYLYSNANLTWDKRNKNKPFISIHFPYILKIDWRSNDYESDEPWINIYTHLEEPKPFTYDFWYEKARDLKKILQPNLDQVWDQEYTLAKIKHVENELMWAKLRQG